MSKHRRAMENRVYRLSAKRVQRLRDSVPVADVALTDDQLRVRKSKSGLMRQAVDAQAMPAVRKQSFEKNSAEESCSTRDNGASSHVQPFELRDGGSCHPGGLTRPDNTTARPATAHAASVIQTARANVGE
jgi:hypothetical protein